MKLQNELLQAINLVLSHNWPSKITHASIKSPVPQKYLKLDSAPECYRIYICTNGNNTVVVPTKSGEKRIKLKAGEAIVAYPGCWIHGLPPRKTSIFDNLGIQVSDSAIEFSENSNRSWPFRDLSFDLPTITSEENIQSVRQAVELFNNPIMETSPNISKSIVRLVYKLLKVELSQEINPKVLNKKQRNRYHLQQLIFHLDRNFNQPLTREKLAKQFNLANSTVAKFFKYELNTTFRKYLTMLRMKYAAELLFSATYLNVSAISKATGYSQDESFSYAFEKYFGLTPTAFRNTMTGSKQATEIVPNTFHNTLKLLSIRELQIMSSKAEKKVSITIPFTNLSNQPVETFLVTSDNKHVLYARVQPQNIAYLKIGNNSIIIIKNLEGKILGGYFAGKQGNIAVYR